ncbi:hypothetical protein F4861DRAFT_540253 [Xylaria intraflava]|nr:hypothetical protein F4861DRAFT_540253 [Xylaria intraflava]
MPTNDYVSAGTGGALKLKGAKVQKSKKKKSDKTKQKDKSTNLERSLHSTETQSKERDDSNDIERAASDRESEAEYKTEAERRHEEAMKKKMQRMLEDPTLASEIRKTHKERVESLNTYLSKLSEHHDMPKIGPG